MGTATGPETVESHLISLNTRLLEAEQRASAADIEFLATVLADTLLFRRADGSLADKTTYLRDVPAGTQRLKDRRGSHLEVHVLGRSALVTLTITGIAETGGRQEARAFRNIRFFVEHDGRWLLEHWYNEPERPHAPTA